MSNEDDFDSFLAGFNLDELENPDSVAAAATTTPSTPLQKNFPPTSSDSPPQAQYLRPSQFHKKTAVQVPRQQQQQQRLQQTLPPPQHKKQASVTPQKRSPPRDMPSPFASYLDDTNDPLPQYDQDAAKTWVYPVKYEKRQYQYDIVRSALFNNTLVCLPTGLGKTFIAAAVILNYYRWFPNGKVVFIAPTKPLVSQQIKAVHDCTGIPKEDQCELTGSIKPSDRVGLWGEKRVFYVTSDIISNDISSGISLYIITFIIHYHHISLHIHIYIIIILLHLLYTLSLYIIYIYDIYIIIIIIYLLYLRNMPCWSNTIDHI